MVDCAGGILKNEGPLAFYKVRTVLPEPNYHAIILLCREH